MIVKGIISENDRRRAIKFAPFDPLTGLGSVGERFKLCLSDFTFKEQYLPIALKKNALVRKLQKVGSFDALLKELGTSEETCENDRDILIKKFVKIRAKEDFPFWATMFATIKNKDGGEDIKLHLNRSQRRLVKRFEKMRLAGKPIRLNMLKSRQWGGSTCIQMYMAWIMLMHKKGWNSLVVSHVMQSTTEVKGMFTKLMENYPLWMLYDTSAYDEKTKALRPFEGSQSIDIVPQRGSKIKTGTAENPESARGGDSAMVHCTEVAFWKTTENKTPEQIIRSACSGVLLAPLTMIVYESTANGVGDFFHSEWLRSKEGTSLLEPLFVPWYDIEKYELPIDDIKTFAQTLYDNRDNDENYGKYYWWLWNNKGATLEAIHWYMNKLKEYTSHSDMASEYPSDDIEAFKTSGQLVFDPYSLDILRGNCKDAVYVGDISGREPKGDEALLDIKFTRNSGGLLKVWEMPDLTEKIRHRYEVVVDVGGRSKKADYSVIVVLDRYWMMYADKPCIVAQWRGHIRHDLLAWKATQIAEWYDHALLVFESNTLESKDKDRDTDGNHTEYILEEVAGVYDNLYMRTSPQENIVEGAPRKYGFHTNVSTKTAIIDNLVSVIEDNGYIERDYTTIDEYTVYEKKQNGSYGAKSGYHDDCLMTRAIALYISTYKMELPSIAQVAQSQQYTTTRTYTSTI